jgi:site-specific recombinase XerD
MTIPSKIGITAQELAAFNAKAFLLGATQGQLETMAKIYLATQAQNAFDASVKLAGIDYESERTAFLDNAGRTGSVQTRRGYNNSLKKLENYTAKQNIELLALTPAQADDFIYSLKASGAAPSTVRVTTAAVSAFFTFLERRHQNVIHNPFRGTRAMPKNKRVKALAIPDTEEVKAIQTALPARLAAAISVMAGRGLRAGALPTLTIRGKHFSAQSKGKDIKGEFSADIIADIKAAGLDTRKPFEDITGNNIEASIIYHTKKLKKEGKIKAAYSCHDFRHFFARAEYEKDHDPRRIQELLGHESLAITDRYLKTIEEA